MGHRKKDAEPTSSALAEAAKLVDVKPPAEEFRAHVAARVETLAKLGATGAPGGSTAGRLELYREALELGLKKLAEEKARAAAAGPEGSGVFEEPTRVAAPEREEERS